jgi:lysyl-tRNA synthetase class 2
MKKLLAAGEEKIFSFARVWRNREGGPRHRVEFTMLEWYRANEGYETLMDDCAASFRSLRTRQVSSQFRHGDTTCDPRARPRRTTVASEAMRHGVDLLATLPGGASRRARPCRGAGEAGIATAPDDTWSDLFTRLLTERIEPNLGPGPVILDAYPAPEAALARRQPARPPPRRTVRALRLRVELANAFGELTDPTEQRARFEADMDLREALYGDRLPLDEDFLAALAHMPPASGCALGFDRLVMLATGAPRLTDVMWTPPA